MILFGHSAIFLISEQKNHQKNQFLMVFIFTGTTNYVSIEPNTRFINPFKASFLDIPSLIILSTSKAP